MSTKNVFRIAKKGWKEVRGNKDLMLPLLLLPAFLSILMPLIIMQMVPPSGGVAAFLSVIDGIIKPLILITPTMVAIIIASDTIAGEKERKTIESFLVLPLTDREILVGKVLGVLIPSLAASWIGFFIMGLTINIAGRLTLGNYIAIFGDASWWLLEGFLVTILSFMSTLFMVLISGMVRNVKAAQQYSALAVVPIIGLVISGISQAFVLDSTSILILSGMLGAIVAGLAHATTRRLNREKLIMALD